MSKSIAGIIYIKEKNDLWAWMIVVKNNGKRIFIKSDSQKSYKYRKNCYKDCVTWCKLLGIKVKEIY